MILPPHVPRKFLHHGGAEFRPFTGEKVRPVGGGREAFAVRSAEIKEHRETAFTDTGVFFEGVAVLQFHLRLRGVVDVGEFEITAVEPGDGKWQQFIKPRELTFFKMLVEGMGERHGLGFFDQ